MGNLAGLRLVAMECVLISYYIHMHGPRVTHTLDIHSTSSEHIATSLETQALPFPLRPPFAAAFFGFLGCSSLSDASSPSSSSSASLLALFLPLAAAFLGAAFFFGSLM